MTGLAHMLKSSARRHPDAAALVDGPVNLSYSELADLASRLVTSLDAMGLRPGDRLLVATQNRLETCLIYWATQLAGVVFTPVNWRAKAGELSYFLNDSGSTAICYCPAARIAAEEAVPRVFPRLKLDGDQEAWIENLRGAAIPNDLPRSNESMPSVLLYTSGTTGPGKGVPRSHRAERAAASAHVAQNTYVMGERMLGVMPLYHTMGVRVLLAATMVNGLFVCQHKFDAAQSLQLIAAHRLHALYFVPTLYHDLLEQPEFPTTDVSSVRKLGFAGAPMTEDLLNRLDEAFQPEIFVNHYGSSEIYTFTVNQNAVVKPGSAGRAGLNAEIRLIPLDGLDATVDLAPGVPGQIVASLASEEAFEGYWRRPDADKRALVDGWYMTGDVGHFDEAGELFVTGRIDDMIISGGENIMPSEVESVLSRHPSVAEVAVAGLPDARLGQIVAAFIRWENGSLENESALDAFFRASALADFKRPRAYFFTEEIPKSPVGKVLRRLLIAKVA